MRPFEDRLHTIRMRVRRELEYVKSEMLRRNLDPKLERKWSSEEVIKAMLLKGHELWSNFCRAQNISLEEAGEWNDPDWNKKQIDFMRGWTDAHYAIKQEFERPDGRKATTGKKHALQEMKRQIAKARKFGLKVTVEDESKKTED